MDGESVHRLDLSMDWKPGHVAAYLVEGDEGLVLIDAGVSDEGNGDGEEELRSEFDSVGYALADVDALLVTHPHLDHDGRVGTVVEESGATVVAYEGVPASLDLDGMEERVRANVREAGILGNAADEATERWVGSVRRNRECLPPDSVDVLVGDGEGFEVCGHAFEALHTPGHQSEHVCYACDGHLFSGDAIIESFRSVIYNVGFDDGIRESAHACYSTFGRLGDRADSVDRVYPGHGPVFDDLAAAVEGSLESLDGLIEDVRETVAGLDEPSAIDVTMARMGAEQGVEHLIFDNVGALGYLEDEGALESFVDDDGVRRYETVGAGAEEGATDGETAV